MPAPPGYSVEACLRLGLLAAVGAARAVAQVGRLLAADVPLRHQIEQLEHDTSHVVPVALPVLALLRALTRADLIEAAPLVVDEGEGRRPGALVTGVTHPVGLLVGGVELVRVGDERAVVVLVGNEIAVLVRVAGVPDPVPVRIELPGIRLVRAVVDVVRDAVTIIVEAGYGCPLAAGRLGGCPDEGAALGVGDELPHREAQRVLADALEVLAMIPPVDIDVGRSVAGAALAQAA